jgi:hypothetical protein
MPSGTDRGALALAERVIEMRRIGSGRVNLIAFVRRSANTQGTKSTYVTSALLIPELTDENLSSQQR